MPPEPVNGRRPRVVIVGGGFGGLAAAHELRRANADVTLVDRKNHQLFQPLLYQVAAGGLAEGDCASSIRAQLRRQANATVVMAEVTDLDVEARRVTLDRGEQLDYDSLIVACGAESSYFGHDDWRDASCDLKTLADAVALRDRIFGAFEEAERATDPSSRDEWLTFAIVGGGPTGVEVAGQLAILSRHAMKRHFRRIDPGAVRAILLDAGERVVPAFSEKLSAKAARELASLGVTVREGCMVTSIEADGVTIEGPGGEERIAAKTVIWAAGVHAAGLTEILARATGASTDRGGRIKINPDLTVPGHPEISAIGDMANLAGADGRPLPGLATVAIQQARHAAKGIKDGGTGASKPFRYFDKGALAVVGRGKAVCEVRGLELSGLPAFLTYLSVHLYYLGGVPGRRMKVLNAWATAGFGVRQHRVIEGELPRRRATADTTTST
jgi:NADH:ubiquinone reductase (H+-translocating)